MLSFGSVVRVLTILFFCWLSLVSFIGKAIAVPEPLPEVIWTYQNRAGQNNTDQNSTGPDHWADLSPEFSACSTGQSQSPIDLIPATTADLKNPSFHYKPVPLNLLNNGHTIQVSYAPGSYIEVEGKQYALRQFHFHSPSEHTIEGQFQPAELHLVHQSEAGELAVVAILLKTGTEGNNPALDELSNYLPAKAGGKVRTGRTTDASALLPQTTTTYRYSGSLTTPPCTESVSWLIMTEPVLLSAQQLSKYQQLLGHNNRPVQLLNNRVVQLDNSP